MSERKVRVEQSWLPALPMGWGTRRVKDLVSLINGYPFPSELFEAEGGVPLVRIRDIGRNTTETSYLGTPVTSALITSQDVLIGMDGDFTVGRWLGSRPALLNQRVCALRSRDTALLKYIEYALPYPLGIVNQLAYSTTVKHLSSGEVLHTRVPLPDDPRTLKNIVAFLDHETARIDELVREQERLVDLLLEEQSAAVSHVVDTGLPLVSKGKRPTSSLPVSHHPSRWTPTPLMFLTPVERPIMYGIVLPGPHVDNGVPIVKGGDVHESRLKVDRLNRTAQEIESRYKRSRLRPGDIVFSIRGSVGEVAIVPEELSGANLTQDAARISPREGIYNRWLMYALKSHSVSAQVHRVVTGATISGINIRDLKRILVQVPPYEEQVRLANVLDNYSSEIAALIDAARRSGELLRERRSALISAAVTGQLDLSDWQLPEPEAVAEVA